DGRVVFREKDGKPLTGKHRLALGGYLSRLTVGEVAVIDLGDGKGFPLPPAPPRPERKLPPDPPPDTDPPPPPDKLLITTLRLPGDGRAVAACWSADGKAFFLTDAKGTVRRVATDGLKEEARAEVGVKADRLLLSAEGLLVPALEQQVIHLLDPQTL